MTIHYSCPWQHADTKQLLYKLSPASKVSTELFTGATQNLVNLCCFIYKLSHWNIKTGLTLRLSVISFTLEPFSVDTQLQFLVNKVNVCLFFAFSHPSWQPLLIKNWNLKNRNQVVIQYVKPLQDCQLFFFLYHILSSHRRFRKKCLLNCFFPLNLDNQKTQHFFCSCNLFELEPRLRAGITGAWIGDLIWSGWSSCSTIGSYKDFVRHTMVNIVT